jgi:beta-galactosidase
MDMCGFPKDNFYYYKAWWGDKPLVHLLPHWNWKGMEGQPISIWAYSNADRVELFVNGKSQGSHPMPRYGHIAWLVPYQPGWLTAKAYLGDKLVATDHVETTGPPAAIVLKTTRHEILADEEDLTPVEVSIVDSKGRVVPDAMNLVKFSLTGPASVVGVGNGDPSSHEPDKASQRRAFNGLCMALVGGSTRKGAITLRASSPGLRSVELKLSSSG